MALTLADRVKETTTTTGTGTIDLDGAAGKHQTFVSGVGGGSTTLYAIVHQSADEWEVGEGTVTDASPDTLSRDTVLDSTNGGSKVSFSAGTKDVFLPVSLNRVLITDASETITAAWTFDEPITLSKDQTWATLHNFETDIEIGGRPLYDRIVEIVEGVIESRLPTEQYDLSNVTADRVLDANATSDAELADVLATLIQDLQMRQ